MPAPTKKERVHAHFTKKSLIKANSCRYTNVLLSYINRVFLFFYRFLSANRYKLLSFEQIDINGRVMLSDTIAIQVTKDNNSSIKIFPTITNGIIKVQLFDPNDVLKEVIIDDMLGATSVYYTGSGQLTQLNLSNLPNAVYVLKVETARNTVSQKIVKQ